MTFLYWILVPVIGYLLGSLSFSIIISCLFLGRDIRKHGSGNAGATNMTRVFGWVAGVATLAFDVLKAFAAMLIGRHFLGDAGVCLGGMAVMTGHCFPLFHHFKGGKGIATGAAVGFMIDWRVGVSIIAAFLIGALISKKVSIGSIAAVGEAVPWKEVSLLHLAFFLLQIELYCICLGISAFLWKGGVGIGNLPGNVADLVKDDENAATVDWKRVLLDYVSQIFGGERQWLPQRREPRRPRGRRRLREQRQQRDPRRLREPRQGRPRRSHQGPSRRPRRARRASRP